MKKFVRPFLIATLCFNSFSIIPSSSISINSASLVYANENNSQVQLSNNSIINFSNSIQEKTYSGAIQLEQDTRNNLESISNNFNNNLEYNLNIVEVPNNTTLSFNATSGVYLQQVTPQKSENLIFWSNEAESDDFKSGQLINQEDTNYYFGLYNWLLASEDEKENVAIKYNLGDLNQDDLNITLDWFESKQCDTVFKLNETNFSAVYSNLLSAYNPITSETSTNITLPDGTYYIYNTGNKLLTQENTYLDDNSTTYTEINYNFSNANDLKENALILVVGSGINTPVSIEKVKNVSISENQEESANILTATNLDIAETGSDNLDLNEFTELNIVVANEDLPLEELILEVNEALEVNETLEVNEVLEVDEALEVDEPTEVYEVNELTIEVNELDELTIDVNEVDELDEDDSTSNTPTEPPTSNGKVPDILTTDNLYTLEELEYLENFDNLDEEYLILGGQLSISPVNSDDDESEDKYDGKTIKTNSNGIKIAVEKDTSYTYVINDDTMDEKDFKIIDFGDEAVEVYTSTTNMPALDLITVYDSNNEVKSTPKTYAVTTLINIKDQDSSQLVKDLEEVVNKDLEKAEELVEAQLKNQQVKDENIDENIDENTNENTKVVTTHIYMREGADQDYDSIKILAPGQQVVVLEVSENGWNKISYNNQIGYVYGQYLK